MLNFIDTFFYKRERASKMRSQAVRNAKDIAHKNDFGLGSGAVIRSLCASKDQDPVGLDGWKDDKEKFKLDLLNDIKTFLFGRWEKPWRPGLIFDNEGNVIAGFRNIHGRVFKESGNVMGLERNKGVSPFFATLAYVEKENGKILNKEKTTSILSYIPITKDGLPKEKPDYMLPKFHRVINVDFVEGIKKPSFKQVEFKDLELNVYVENFIKSLSDLKRIPTLHYDQSDRAYYSHSLLSWTSDSIHLAPIRQFKNIEGYYSTLFHEITHSTMNPNRCGRGKNGNTIKLDYANEELVAEMGAMIICSELGLEYNRQNSLTYLKGWLKKAGNDPDTAMIEAYSYACDAAEYLMKDIDFEKLVPKSLQERAKKEASDLSNKQRPNEEEKQEENKGKLNLKSKESDQLSLFGTGEKTNFYTAIKQYFAGSFKGNLIEIAFPKKFLLDNDFPNELIAVRSGTLASKIKKHNLDFNHLKHLPTWINSPLMLFKSATVTGAFNIIIERENHEGLLCCSVHPDKKINRMLINEIASIHGRNIMQLVRWVEDGLLMAVQIEKTEKILSDSGFDSPKSKHLLGLLSASIHQKSEIKQEKSQKNTDLDTKALFGFTSLNKPRKKIKTHRLNGHLGEFLGEFDRNQYTIALRGDKGAGKSRLLYQLVNSFASKLYNCAIISAEMSPESLIVQRYIDQYVKPANLKRINITGEKQTFESLNRICKIFDVVALDSWTKMEGLTQFDLDRLQKENPQTIIVSIFQSTTGKVARGGNMVEYDCGTVIHVHEGGKAICEKNRYAPTDKTYNVFTQKFDIEEEVNG